MKMNLSVLQMITAAAFGTSLAHAQTCTPTATTNGPDVIVGDITGPSNYTSTGGYEAFSIGTYSCNIGNVWLNWIDSTNQHPVIGQNMFKMKTAGGYTTFEQIGQSWLKHGFFALSDNLCCNNCSPTDGTHLGVHCADPYTSGRNGSQSGLGPKWQVNAHTGVFTYPPANPSFTGTVARRLTVPIASLEVSSATVRYFVDAQYVSPDDAASGNQNNNTSYRAGSISGSGTAWNLALSGTTQRAQPGIMAWADTEAGVTETPVDVAEAPSGTGRVYVCSKATNLNNGFWHYEYAVYNQNSDRSVGAFSVPVGAGVTVQNIGFHDVEYRDGDGAGNVNFDGTDWPGTFTGGAVSWSTQLFTANANANALRWGTMYNFRFDANIAPAASGNITLTTWKTGGSAYNAAAVVPGVPVVACYPNCDGSTTAPCLNVLDFSCFLNLYAAGNTYANCDASTTPPALNVLDFSCFLNSYAAGCSNC